MRARFRPGRRTMNYLRTAILLAGLAALFMGVGYLIGGGSGAVIALLIAAGMNLASYWNADKLVLAMHDAHEVDESTAPDLVHLVQDLARSAGLPMPRVYLMDNPQPNAFATGRNPEHAAVAATTGLWQMLSREEGRGLRAGEDFRHCGGRCKPHRRARAGNGAPFHRQSADRPRDGQPVLHPSIDRESHRRAATIGGGNRCRRLGAPDCARLSQTLGKPMGQCGQPRRKSRPLGLMPSA